MELIKRCKPYMTRRFVENTILLVLALVLYSYSMGTLPPKLHGFEDWIDFQFPELTKGFGYFWREYSRFGQNDTNAAVRSPFWLFLLFTTTRIFDNPLIAHRIPSVFITALTPMLFAEIVRRFYRRDLAFVFGLTCVGAQHLMFLGRIGGYVGPSTTIFMYILLSSLSIAWEGNKRAWVHLCIGLVLMPMMYATIRYMSLMGGGIIALSFLTSGEFRRRQLKPMLASLVFLLMYFSLYVHGSIYFSFIEFWGARGEQALITDQVIAGAPGEEQVSFFARVSKTIAEKTPEQLNKLVPIYTDGSRFYNWHYQFYEHNMHKVVLALFLIGMAVALIKSFHNPRYLLIPIWSVYTWVPLLLTTGLTNNRMLNGIPADLFLVVLAVTVPYDIINKFLPAKLKWVTHLAMLCLASYFVYFSFTRMIIDCVRFCR